LKSKEKKELFFGRSTPQKDSAAQGVNLSAWNINIVLQDNALPTMTELLYFSLHLFPTWWMMADENPSLQSKMFIISLMWFLSKESGTTKTAR